MGRDGEVDVTGAVDISRETGETKAAIPAWAAWWRAARARGKRAGRGGEGRDGVGGTWVSNDVGKIDRGEAATGRKCVGGFLFTGPDYVTDATTNWEFDLEDISLQENLLVF